jgi:hypothetical protein
MPVVTAVRFPSLAWFEALNETCNKQDLFRKKRDGACDAIVGIKVGERIFELTFEAFRVAGVREVTEAELPGMDFWLEQSPDKWRAMLSSIRQIGRAEGDFTCNSLDLLAESDFARSFDGHRRDAFYRFNQTFQDYFDASAALDTAFD